MSKDWSYVFVAFAFVAVALCLLAAFGRNFDTIVYSESKELSACICIGVPLAVGAVLAGLDWLSKLSRGGPSS